MKESIVTLCKSPKHCFSKILYSSDLNSEREPRRMREDPVAFMLNVGLYYQGTVSLTIKEPDIVNL